MPLIIISGLPSSGKSQRANELKEYFIRRNKVRHHQCCKNKAKMDCPQNTHLFVNKIQEKLNV